MFKAGARRFERRFKSRRWDSDQSRKANRVKGPQVRLTHAGVGSFPVVTPRNRRLTTSGVLPKNADREKLNDERGASPCQ